MTSSNFQNFWIWIIAQESKSFCEHSSERFRESGQGCEKKRLKLKYPQTAKYMSWKYNIFYIFYFEHKSMLFGDFSECKQFRESDQYAKKRLKLKITHLDKKKL